jgi:hypothetical protein
MAPDILIESFDFEPDILLRPILDFFWQAAEWLIVRTTGWTEGGLSGAGRTVVIQLLYCIPSNGMPPYSQSDVRGSGRGTGWSS